MPYLPILTYHRVLSENPTKAVDPKRIAVGARQFENHLTWLRRLGYRSIKLEDYVQALREGKSVASRTLAITFDDGYEDVYRWALPLLQRIGFQATIFAVPGELDGINRWDDGGARLMSGDQFHAWSKAGMEIGAHTAHHPHLPALAAEDARREIVESKSALESLLQKEISLFAYPYGEYSDTVRAAVCEAKFSAAFATDRASRDHADDLFALRRAVVFPSNTAWNILWKAQKWYPAYQDYRRSRA